MGNFFARRAATDQRLLKRSCESLLGICSGILADGRLADEEIRFLDTWLADNDDISTTWPGEVVFARVRGVSSDGVITEDEREHLKTALSELLGGTLEDTGATSGMATRLPVDDVDVIKIADNSFCFTGNFLYGTRKACENAIVQRGGEPSASVRTDLNYLVIGTLASREWAHTSHGRKIDGYSL
jgi:hypothetical protein